MKFILPFLFALLLSITVQAQTAMNAQMAQTYMANCVSNQDPRMSPETQGIFCQCTVNRMQKTISVEEMKIMAQQTQNSIAIQNKVLTQVYAPCMEFPVRDLIFNKCQTDTYQSKQGICMCMSGRMATFVSTESQRLLGSILQRTPNLADPIGAIMETPEFTQKEKRIVLECIQNPNSR